MQPYWRVLLLDTKEGNVNHHITVGIEDALKKHPDVVSCQVAGYADALTVARVEQCNLFLAVDGQELDRGLCQRLAHRCGTSALWLADDPYDRRRNLLNGELFTRVYTNDSNSVSAYGGKARHLPFAGSPPIHQHAVPFEDDGHYLYDLFFAGMAWPNRIELLRQIIAALPGIKMKLAMPHNEHLKPAELGIAASSFRSRIPNNELARFANRSRIVLTLHRSFATGGNDETAHTPGPRLFEVALAGGFQLVDDSLPESGRYFEPEREIVLFNSVADCVAKVKYYLDHPAERLAITHAAQRRCQAEHLYAHRVETILSDLRDLSSAPASIPVAAVPRDDQLALPARVSERSGKLRVLHVAHNYITQQPIGGVEVYIDLVTRTLADQHDSLIYFPDRKQKFGKTMCLHSLRDSTTFRHTFASEFDKDCLSDFEREVYFAHLLHDQRIDLVHFHHLIGHPLSLPLVARMQGIPAVLSMPDHYSVCSRFNLINHANRYCNAAEIPLASCDICLKATSKARFGTQGARRAFVSAMLDNVDSIIFLSQDTRRIAEAIYPSLADHPRLHAEGYPTVPRPVMPRLTASNRLQVAIPGNFNSIKGADNLCRIFDALRDDPIDFHIHGRVDPPFDWILRELNLPTVILHGAYKPDTLHDKLSVCDVALLLSTWPETYVLTLSESFRARVVPVVTDIGALGERVRDGYNGRKVPIDEAGAVVAALRDLASNRRELERLRANLDDSMFLHLDAHVAFLTGLYDELLAEYRQGSRKALHYSEAPTARRAAAENIYIDPADAVAVSLQHGNSGLINLVRNRLGTAVRIARKVPRHLRNHGVRHTLHRIHTRIKHREI